MLDELILFSNCFSLHLVRLVAAPEQLGSMEEGDIMANIEVHYISLTCCCLCICFAHSYLLVLALQCMSDATFHGKPFSSTTTHSEPFLHALLETFAIVCRSL